MHILSSDLPIPNSFPPLPKRVSLMPKSMTRTPRFQGLALVYAACSHIKFILQSVRGIRTNWLELIEKRKTGERGIRSAHKFRDWQMPQIQFTTNNQFRIERSQVDSWPPFVRLLSCCGPASLGSQKTHTQWELGTHPPITRAKHIHLHISFCLFAFRRTPRKLGNFLMLRLKFDSSSQRDPEETATCEKLD